MRKAITLFFLSLIMIACSESETKKIENLFYEFNEANIATNGEKIYELTDGQTHQYYADLLEMVLSYDSAEVAAAKLVDKINILTARAVISDTVLLNLDAKGYLVKMYTAVNTMDQEKISATRSMKIKNIEIAGNLAKGELAPGGRSLPERVYMEFVKEDGEWKYNLLSMLEFTNNNITNMLSTNGMTHSDFINIVFMDPSIQEKLVRSQEESWNAIK